jgi:pimeloyl-ACP methyl ester carboxylesterase
MAPGRPAGPGRKCAPCCGPPATSCGRRPIPASASAHLANPAIDLDTHIADVTGVLETEDLRDIVLVAHSYGGMVATGVADRVRERIAQLIYLDAFVPHDGQSLFDLQPADARARMRELARTDGEGWRLPPTQMPADTPDADVAWASGRRRPQPIRTFEQPLRLAGNAAPPPRSYIYCRRIGGRVPPVRRARSARKRLALFRDRRQP